MVTSVVGEHERGQIELPIQGGGVYKLAILWIEAGISKDETLKNLQ